MKRLVIGGGGSPEQSAKIDQEWVRMIDSDSPVLYIPWAQKETNLSEAEAWFRDTYTPMLGGRAIHIAQIDSELDRLQNYASVYIGGGNTGRLINQIDKVGGRDRLRRYVENGGLVYGGSAGAIILGKTLHTAPEVGETSQNTDGLDLLNGYSIVCHYDGDSRRLPVLHAPIVALPEDGGLVYDGEDIRSIGGVIRYGDPNLEQRW